MSTLKTKRRAIYPYECVKCGENRSSLIYSRAVEGVCRLCRNSEQSAGQRSLFDSDKKCDECNGSGELYIPAQVTGSEIQDEQFQECFKCKGSGIVESESEEN